MESIEFQDAAWRREVIPVAAGEGFVAVRGWAVDGGAGYYEADRPVRFRVEK